VRSGRRLIKVAQSTEPTFWCLADDGQGGVYAGSGDNGVVYHVAKDGTLRPFARTGEQQVFCLLRTGDSLYAGTGPNGRLFKIGVDGKAERIADFGEKYVLSLTTRHDGDLYKDNGEIYVGVGGSKGRVYRVKRGVDKNTGTHTAFYTKEVLYEGETSVTALCFALPTPSSPQSGFAASYTLYAGTAPNGLVTAISTVGNSAPVTLYDAPEPSVMGLGVTYDAVYAGFGPRGSVVEIPVSNTRAVLSSESVRKFTPLRSPRILLERLPQGTLSGLTVGNDATVYAVAGSTVYAIQPSATVGNTPEVRTFESATDIQATNALWTENGLMVSTAGTGGVYRLGSDVNAQNELVSSVFDTRAGSRFGTIRWDGTGQITLQTRTGATAQPDSSWSEWSRPYTVASGETITSPMGRYAQWKATFPQTQGTQGEAVLRSVEVFYLPPNQAPRVALTGLRGGEVWRGTQTLRWSATDPDRDTLTYDVTISGDNGKTWQPLPGFKAGFSDAGSSPVPMAPTPPANTPVPPATTPAKSSPVERELDNLPELSPALRARILSDANRLGSTTATGQGTPLPAPTNLSGNAPTGARDSATLDTTRLPDGVYLVRVVASDKLANPTEPQTGEQVSAPFRIVNKAPTVTVSGSPNVQTDRTVKMEGTAAHPSEAQIRAVQYRVNNGEWASARATDGIFDSRTESWAIQTAVLPSGSHTIEIQAVDEAGNAQTQTVRVQVP
jgi:hypothetical protein